MSDLLIIFNVYQMNIEIDEMSGTLHLISALWYSDRVVYFEDGTRGPALRSPSRKVTPFELQTVYTAYSHLE